MVYRETVDFVTKVTREGTFNAFASHLNPNVRTTRQGQATCRKHNRLKLGRGQAYDRSSD
jgi:hypothetical protein